MKKTGFFIFSLFVCIAINNTSFARGYADVVEKVMPSVVSISVIQDTQQRTTQNIPTFPPGSPFEKFFKDYNPNNPQTMQQNTSVGSGFIVDKSGIIMTNLHVIEKAKSLNVIFHDGTIAKAEILNFDKKADLALIKIKGNYKLKAITFGDSDKARIGDEILAIGNPFGLGTTVTSGIISARSRDIKAGPYDDFLQTDAPINRGNSGGPMFNMNGEVIGINTAIFSPSGGSVGIGFAIPSNMAKMAFESLMKHGKVRRGQIGVQIQSVTEDIAKSLGLDNARGAMIAGINKNSPAEKAGILIGDVVLSIDNKEIDSMRQLPKQVAESQIGESIPIVVWRNGREVSLDIIVEEMGDDPEEISKKNLEQENTPTTIDEILISELGFTIANITEDIRKKYKLSKDTKGVIITDISPASEAENKDLKIGDIIVEAKQTPILKTSDIKALVKTAIDQNLKSILMLVNNQNGLQFIALRLK